MSEAKPSRRCWLLLGTCSHLWFQGVYEGPLWYTIACATVTVHWFFRIWPDCKAILAYLLTLSMCLTSTFWFTLAFKFWNLLDNLTIISLLSSAVSCLYFLPHLTSDSEFYIQILLLFVCDYNINVLWRAFLSVSAFIYIWITIVIEFISVTRKQCCVYIYFRRNLLNFHMHFFEIY